MLLAALTPALRVNYNGRTVLFSLDASALVCVRARAWSCNVFSSVFARNVAGNQPGAAFNINWRKAAPVVCENIAVE